MPITPTIRRALAGTRVSFEVTPDDADTTPFVNSGANAFTVGDVSISGTGAVIENFTFGASKTTFDVLLPHTVGTFQVTVAASGVQGLANNLTATLTSLQAFLWTSQTRIQSYLDGNGKIQIRQSAETVAEELEDNFSQITAASLENESVYEIATVLSMAFQAEATPKDIPSGKSASDLESSIYGITPLGFKPAEDITNVGTFCPMYLSLLAAKLTASKIGGVRLGTSLAYYPTWAYVYKGEVYSQLQRWAINAETADIQGLQIRSDYELSEILIKAKTREDLEIYQFNESQT